MCGFKVTLEGTFNRTIQTLNDQSYPSLKVVSVFQYWQGLVCLSTVRGHCELKKSLYSQWPFKVCEVVPSSGKDIKLCVKYCIQCPPLLV